MRNDRLAIARFMIDSLAPVVKASGVVQPATATQPHHWSLERHNLLLVLTENALLKPDDKSTSSLLDIWLVNGRKVFSTSWEPQRPWKPPVITRLQTGDWMAAVGYPRGRSVDK